MLSSSCWAATEASPESSGVVVELGGFIGVTADEVRVDCKVSS